jgi:hypothetical protein
MSGDHDDEALQPLSDLHDLGLIRGLTAWRSTHRRAWPYAIGRQLP